MYDEQRLFKIYLNKQGELIYRNTETWRCHQTIFGVRRDKKIFLGSFKQNIKSTLNADEKKNIILGIK